MSLRFAAVVLALATAVGCATARPGRFKDQPVVWSVDDAHDIPEPSERGFYGTSYFINAYIWNRLRKGIDPPSRGPARDTNALDEVPDSTWFENRIGRRDITPDELRRGVDSQGPPELPLTIKKAKHGGNPGFFAKDARGVTYLIKFDTEENPEQQSAGDVVVNRLFWAIGYHVPSDHVVSFQRDQILIADKLAKSLDEPAVDRIMRAAVRRDDGAIRALASEFLPGKPKGGWSSEGTRGDDRNDTIPHQHRRVVRGLRVFAAWLGHTDMKENNTLDMYVEEDGRHFLRHYLVDFGEALGGHQSEKQIREIGWEYGWDWGAQAKGLLSFGLWVRDWEDQKETPWPAIGWFGADQFDPDEWHERYPYEPFYYTDRVDNFWAAKLIMRFDRPLIEAAVDEGQFSDPDAGAYLVDTLLKRREKIGAAYLDRVTPLDDFTVADGKLCATDLSRKYKVASDGVLEVIDRPGTSFDIANDGRVCIPLAEGADYHLERLRIRRGKRTTPRMQVHYVGGANARLLGIVRHR